MSRPSREIFSPAVAWLLGVIVQVIIAFGLLLLLLCLCFGCTVTPKVVHNKQGSFDGNEANSGILGLDPAGNAIVTPHYRDRYNGLVASYGARFSPPVLPDAGLVPTGTNTFLIDRQHRFYFDTMNRWRKQGAPLWDKP